MVVHGHIKDKLLVALQRLQSAIGHLEAKDGSGFDYATAHRFALEGLKEAESAFFDREMVSLLYYPPEHEAAIYIPHFLPVFYPIVVGLLFDLKSAIFRRVRKWWRRRQATSFAATITAATSVPPSAGVADSTMDTAGNASDAAANGLESRISLEFPNIH